MQSNRASKAYSPRASQLAQDKPPTSTSQRQKGVRQTAASVTRGTKASPTKGGIETRKTAVAGAKSTAVAKPSRSTKGSQAKTSLVDEGGDISTTPTTTVLTPPSSAPPADVPVEESPDDDSREDHAGIVGTPAAIADAPSTTRRTTRISASPVHDNAVALAETLSDVTAATTTTSSTTTTTITAQPPSLVAANEARQKGVGTIIRDNEGAKVTAATALVKRKGGVCGGSSAALASANERLAAVVADRDLLLKQLMDNQSSIAYDATTARGSESVRVAELESLKRELADKNTEIAELRRRLTKALNREVSADTDVEALLQQVAEKETAAREVQARADAEVEALRQELFEKHETHATTSAALEEHAVRSADLEAKVATAHAALEEARSAHATATAELETLRRELAEKHESSTTIGTALEEHTKRCAHLEASVASLTAKLDASEASASNAKAAADAREKELLRQLAELQATHGACAAQQATDADAVKTLREEVEGLKRDREAFEKQARIDAEAAVMKLLQDEEAQLNALHHGQIASARSTFFKLNETERSQRASLKQTAESERQRREELESEVAALKEEVRAKTAALEAAQKQQATSSPTKGKKSNPFAAASDADSSSAAALVAAERAKMEKEFAEKMKQIEDEHSAQLAEEVTKATKAADDKVEAEVKRRLEELEANANEDSKAQAQLSKEELIRENERAALEKIKLAQAKHNEAKNAYEWLMHTQDEMRVLGDEYVPEAQDVKFNKSELQKALKKALKSPRVYSEAVTARPSDVPKGFEKLFLKFIAKQPIEILYLESPPKGVWVARDAKGTSGFLRTTDFVIEAEVIKKTLGLE